MYAKPLYQKTLIKCDRTLEGETIEKKVKRLVANKEPIKDGSPIIYTDKKDGVQPQYNVRTDRFELAAEAMDKVHRSKEASSDNVAKVIDMKGKKEVSKPENEVGKPESTPGKADDKSSVQ